MEDIISQNILISSGKFENEKNYWLGILSGDLTTDGFPIDYSRPQKYSNETNRINFKFSTEICESIINLCNGSSYGILTVLLSGISYLTYRNSNIYDFVIGIPIFNQDSNVKPIANNVLPLRYKINIQDTFKNLIIKTKNMIMEANENSNYPINHIYNLLEMPEYENRCKLFDTMVVFKEIHDETIIKNYKADIIFEFSLENQIIICDIKYNKTLFKESTITNIWKQLLNLYSNVLGNLDTIIEEIDLLSEEEKRKLLYEYNNTKVEYPKPKSIYGIFKEQFKRNPNRVAIKHNKKKITYSELNNHINYISQILNQRYSIKQGDIIGLCLPRSIEMVVGALSILKIGAVCLPIDYKYPNERISYMIQDSNTKLVIKHSSTNLLLEKDIEIIDLDTMLDVDNYIYNSDIHMEDTNNTNEDHAYIIYTSGSTGKPKGVILNQGGIINHIRTKIEVFKLKQNDILCLSLNICFVASIWQIFTPLFLGTQLVIVDDDILVDAYQLFQYIESEQITVLQIVPTFLSAYIEAIEIGRPKVEFNSLRLLILTGEKVNNTLVNRFYNNYSIQLGNAYGQSECSDDTLHYLIPIDKNTEIVPLGKPSNNTRVYILNKDMRLQPIGVWGELCISGDGVASGYLNNPKLTREKFVANPFEKENKMYKTGDVARWNDDGNIEFWGRTDEQVKIRGFRIELGEIENVILKYKTITQAVLVLKEYDETNKLICVYYTATSHVDVSELREYLLREIPDYMVPSYYVQLNKIPLTPSGKVDKRKLAITLDESEKEKVENIQKTGLTKLLCEVWEKVLESKDVELDNNYFSLGGDSIKAITICTILYKYGIELNVKDIFNYPSIKKLAKYIETSYLIKNELTLKNLNDLDEDFSAYKISCNEIIKLKEYLCEITDFNIEIEDVYPLSPSQERMLFYSLFYKNSNMYCQQSIFSISGKLDIDIFKKSYDILADKYNILRSVFSYKKVKEFPVQIIIRGLNNIIQFQDISNLDICELKKFIEQKRDEDINRGFNLSKEYPVRINILKTNENNYTIIWNYHHIIMDGWSTEVVFQEFFNVYNSLLSNTNINLVNKYQYKNYIQWLYKQNKLNAESYWLKYLDNYCYKDPFLQYKQKARKGDYRNGQYVSYIDRALFDKLNILARDSKVTMSTLIHAAWGVLLNKYSGEQDIVFGTVVSGRPSKLDGVENMVGLFVNINPVRIVFNNSTTFFSILQQIQSNLLDAEDFNYISLSKIQELMKHSDIMVDHVIAFENYPKSNINIFERKSSINNELIIYGRDFYERTHYDLNIVLIPKEQFEIKFNYNSLIFSDKLITEFSKNLIKILENIVSNSMINIKDFVKCIL